MLSNIYSNLELRLNELYIIITKYDAFELRKYVNCERKWSLHARGLSFPSYLIITRIIKHTIVHVLFLENTEILFHLGISILEVLAVETINTTKIQIAYDLIDINGRTALIGQYTN